jgi:hypothetical protein
MVVSTAITGILAATYWPIGPDQRRVGDEHGSRMFGEQRLKDWNLGRRREAGATLPDQMHAEFCASA